MAVPANYAASVQVVVKLFSTNNSLNPLDGSYLWNLTANGFRPTGTLATDISNMATTTSGAVSTFINSAQFNQALTSLITGQG